MARGQDWSSLTTDTWFNMDSYDLIWPYGFFECFSKRDVLKHYARLFVLGYLRLTLLSHVKPQPFDRAPRCRPVWNQDGARKKKQGQPGAVFSLPDINSWSSLMSSLYQWSWTEFLPWKLESCKVSFGCSDSLHFQSAAVSIRSRLPTYPCTTDSPHGQTNMAERWQRNIRSNLN